jgi:hypothetical protein
MTQEKTSTEDEIELAIKLFAEAKANGALRAPRPIAASIGRSHGIGHSVKASTVTWRDYLVVARLALRPKRK